MNRVEEYFEQARWLPQEITEIQMRMDYMRSQADSISSIPFGRDIVTGTKDLRSPQEKLTMKLCEMEQDLLKKLNLNIALQEQMDDIVEALPSQQDRQVLRLRFIHNMKWEPIAKLMYCDGKTAKRWCDEALNHVKLPEDAIFLDA